MADVDAEVFNTTVIGMCAGAVAGVALTLGGVALIKYYRRKSKKPKNMKLYHSFPFRSLRCAWLVKELGVENDVEILKIDLHSEKNEELEQYRETVHPHGTLPGLVVDDKFTILESGAICLYLADLYGKLVPMRFDRKEYYNWIVYATATIDSVLEPLYMQLTHTPEEQRDQALIERQHNKFAVIAKHLNTVLQNRTWICGDRFTAADCVIGYDVWWASFIKKGELLRDYPALVAYADRVRARPALQSCLPAKLKTT
ncbi:glutathione S-transferase GstA-like [Ptychodera flava]|uniref:glutathione S-transferase GstA-like n=1 Tax=Ptychodera flava TaxID=63121 RepID=UPI003969DF53